MYTHMYTHYGTTDSYKLMIFLVNICLALCWSIAHDCEMLSVLFELLLHRL